MFISESEDIEEELEDETLYLGCRLRRLDLEWEGGDAELSIEAEECLRQWRLP